MTVGVMELPGLAGPGAGAAAEAERGEAPASAASVIGLDLSLTGTGMSDGQTTWLIRSSGGKGDGLAQRAERLRTLARSICGRIAADTQLVVIESPAFSRTMGHAHDRSGLWWLVVNALHGSGVPVAEATPQAVKLYATGKGNGDKHAVIDATARRYPLIETGANDNRADALWLAAIGIDHLTGVHVVPEAHRRALDKIRWPEGVSA